MHFLLRRVALPAAGLALCANPATAQRNAPATYAITNAKLVPVSGPVIAKGTIIVRDGLIAAIGANVSVPGDARIIDGTGLTVYPGLFDSYGSIGLAGASAAAAGGGRGGNAAAAAIAALAGQGTAGASTTRRGGSGNTFDDPRGVEPDIRAAELVQLNEDALDGPRSAGITSALAVPTSGIFVGQSALINLEGSTPAAMIVRPNVAQHIAIATGGRGGGGGGGYPGSLMGVFAVIRQELLDAGHYRDLKAAYEKNPRSMQRVEFDPGLDALLPALARQQPVVITANSEREIERALDLAKEFNIRLIISGGTEAYRMIDRLKAENVPVLLSLNFPRKTAAAVVPGAEVEPDAMRVLRERVEAPKNAARLATAGVKFAFVSGGLTNWSDFETNMQRAIDAGLAPDAAIKAVTSQPAELFGVSDRMGSLDVGKIANLTVTRGDLNEKTARVVQLFIDGRPVALHPPTTQAGGAGGFGGRGATPPPTDPESQE